MQYAVTHILSDDGGADKVVAVVDGRGAGSDSEHRPRYVRQAKHLASILTQVSFSWKAHSRAAGTLRTCAAYMHCNAHRV